MLSLKKIFLWCSFEESVSRKRNVLDSKILRSSIRELSPSVDVSIDILSSYESIHYSFQAISDGVVKKGPTGRRDYFRTKIIQKCYILKARA